MPLLGIAGAYTSERGILVGVAFLSLFISLLGIVYFLVVLLAERNRLVEYLTWLQHELTAHCCRWEAKFEPSIPQPTNTAGGGSSLPNNDVSRVNGGVATAQLQNHSQHSLTEEEVSPSVHVCLLCCAVLCCALLWLVVCGVKCWLDYGFGLGD